MADVFLKDPDEVLDYTVDLSTELGADTITGTPTWTVPIGITKASQSNTTTTITAFFSGGTAGTDYLIGWTVTTTGGRTINESFIIRVRSK